MWGSLRLGGVNREFISTLWKGVGGKGAGKEAWLTLGGMACFLDDMLSWRSGACACLLLWRFVLDS